MYDIGVKQGCPLSHKLFGLYIDVLKTFLDEIDEDSLCLFNTMIAVHPLLMMLFYFLCE